MRLSHACSSRLQDYTTAPKVHMAVPLPSPDNGHTVFDYCLHKRSAAKGLVPGRWQLWTDTIPELDIPADAQFADIIIPTKDSAR